MARIRFDAGPPIPIDYSRLVALTREEIDAQALKHELRLQRTRRAIARRLPAGDKPGSEARRQADGCRFLRTVILVSLNRSIERVIQVRVAWIAGTDRPHGREIDTTHAVV